MNVLLFLKIYSFCFFLLSTNHFYLLPLVPVRFRSATSTNILFTRLCHLKKRTFTSKKDFYSINKDGQMDGHTHTPERVTLTVSTQNIILLSKVHKYTAIFLLLLTQSLGKTEIISLFFQTQNSIYVISQGYKAVTKLFSL